MATTLASELIVRLIDQVTGPANKVAASLRGITSAAGLQSTNNKLATALENNNAALEKTRGKLVDAIGGYYALKEAIAAPIEKATDFQSLLLDIGQKADMPTASLKALGDQLQGIARQTNQSATEIGKSVDTLIGFGASQDVAMKAAAPIGEAATAYRAATDDLARAVFASTDNLKVPADQTAFVLDMLARAGKEGAFEIKDMAKEFPALTAGAQFLGMKGAPAVADLAAALEVARKGAADGATAANNMANFIQKINSPQTVKNFAKFGINVADELKKAAADGQSPIEHMLDVIGKVTNGDSQKLGQLFQDRQVQEFIKPMLANMGEYKRIRDAALASQGTVDRDFGERLDTAQGSLDKIATSIQNLNIAIGNTLLPDLQKLASVVVPLITDFEQWADAHPKLTAAILETAGALVAFRVATIGLTFAGLIGKGGALEALTLAYNTLGKAVRSAGAFVEFRSVVAALSGTNYGGLTMTVDALKGFALAVPGVSSLAEGVGALGAAIGAISLPVLLGVGVGVAAVATAGLAVWKYWDRLSSIFEGVGAALSGALQPAIAPLQPWLDRLAAIGQPITDAFGKAWKAIQDFFSAFANPERLTGDQKEAFRQAGYNWMTSLLTGMQQMMGGILQWFATWPQQILNAIGTIDLTKSFHLPSAGELVQGGVSAAQGAAGAIAGGVGAATNAIGSAFSGHRASGGPVWPGGSFLVGERGAETFVPDRPGRIVPAGQSGGVTVNFSVTINGVAHDAREIARRVRQVMDDELGQMLRGLHADTDARY